MTREQSEIFDCGAFARISGYSTDSCPSYPNPVDRALWLAGWRRVSSMTKEEKADVLVRKQFATFIPE